MGTETDDRLNLELRFEDPEEEAAFTAANAARAQLLIRYTFPLSALIFFLFWFIDRWLFDRFGDPVFALALGFAALTTTTVGLCAWRSCRPSALMQLVPWVLAVNGLALSVAVARCTALGAPEPYGIMAVHVLYVFFLAGLLTRDAVVVTLFSGAAYLICHLWINELTPLIAERLASLMVLVGIGILGIRIQEHVRRRNWLLTRELAAEARHDPLTGLANRRALFDEAGWLFTTAAREQKPLSVMLVDVDYFKLLNDHRGHAAGDFALRQIAEAVQRAARRGTDTAARYGGEEFLVLLYDCAPTDGERRAEQLRAEIQQLPIDHPGSPFRAATASIGLVGAVPAPGEGLGAWTAEADALLYKAKTAGRNRVAAAARKPETHLPERLRRYR